VWRGISMFVERSKHWSGRARIPTPACSLCVCVERLFLRTQNPGLSRDMPVTSACHGQSWPLDLRFISVRHLFGNTQTYANNLSMNEQIETDFLHVLFVLSMNFIPTLPRRERTHVKSPAPPGKMREVSSRAREPAGSLPPHPGSCGKSPTPPGKLREVSNLAREAAGSLESHPGS